MPAAAPTREGPAVPAPSRSLLRFRQGNGRYAIPAEYLIAAIGTDRLQRFMQPLDGWAGVVPIQGGTLPVLDAGALLGQRGAPQAVLMLRTEHGPLGLAVERVESLLDADQAWTPLPAAPAGVLGGFIQEQAMTFVLDPRRLEHLRHRALRPDDEGRLRPAPVHWCLPPAPRGQTPMSPPTIGRPVLVLGETLRATPAYSLALTVDWVVAVTACGEVYPGPPAPKGLTAFRTWNEAPLPIIDPALLDIAGAPAGGSTLLIVLKTGMGLLTGRARGVQALRSSAAPPPEASPFIIGYGGVRGQSADGSGTVGVGILDPVALTHQFFEQS